jgi:hypothetical protein
MDLFDLKNCATRGMSLQESARFLCRSGSLHDVSEKAKELRLKWRPTAGALGPIEP